MNFYISKTRKYEKLEIIHKCKFLPEIKQIEYYQYGEAIDNEIFYNKFDDNFLISNNEYCSIINFCPWCGINLNTLLEKINK